MEIGINARSLSHTQTMEKQTQQNGVSTKEKEVSTERGVLLSAGDAEEFRAYKRRKKIAEVSSAIARSEASLLGGDDVQRVCERATRLNQAAIKLPVTKLSQAKYYLATGRVQLDCHIGGDGETMAKVKAYETRLAVRRGANEITVPVTPSLVDSCRYSVIRKEIRKVVRAAGRANVKVRMEKTNSPTALSRVARIACETGAKYFSVPYFKGCERLRLDLTHGCQLEVSDVEETDEFRRLTAEGVGRIVTDRAWEIYSQWLKEACEAPLSAAVQALPEKAEQKQPLPAPALPQTTIVPTPVVAKEGTNVSDVVKNSETEYCCRLEGESLKFL